jgi:hypothetical protein
VGVSFSTEMTEREIDEQELRPIHIQSEKYIKQRDRESERQRDRETETERQRDRETERETGMIAECSDMKLRYFISLNICTS